MKNKEIEQKIEEFLMCWPDAEFGPAHIVLSDGNTEPCHLAWCAGILYAVQEARQLGISRFNEECFDFYANHSDAELEATRLFLDELLTGASEITIKSSGDVQIRNWRDITPAGPGVT